MVSCLKVLSAARPFRVSNLAETDHGQSGISLSKALQYVSESRMAQAPVEWPTPRHSLTAALAELGITHEEARPGHRLLVDSNGDRITPAVDSATGWVLVALIRAEAHPLSTALIKRAQELAA